MKWKLLLMPRNNFIPKGVQLRIKYWQYFLNIPWKVIAEVMRVDSRRRYRIVNDRIHMGSVTYARLLLLNSYLETCGVGLNPLDLAPLFKMTELDKAFRRIVRK